MKKPILIIAIIFSGMLMQAQEKNATEIIVKTQDISGFIDYLTDNNIFFFKIDKERGIAMSDNFELDIRGSHRMARIKLREKNGYIHITGSVQNPWSEPLGGNGIETVQMINKKGFAGGHVGGWLFRYIDELVKLYEDRS